ncbi:hypothetical protein KP77_25460 [Jeotgalibacillus alimentarius]|uniref:YopX protein domain-containing protein n=1 Tax=Jeotgalibacillus alimentarius TaxID=135826 RepID=A0A0C2VDG3_9BACL|nr:YopX family protein [Jeotgalibacillus alimentarius]KIL46977.1 hypothetical protein KP77_25460 [Jeotgalibacillus alimentarius]
MEEFKFRGKPMMTERELHELNIKHENGWVYGNLVISDYAYFITGGFAVVNDEYASLEWWIRVDKESVGQYTGLKDKSDRAIFGGDIIEFNDQSYARTGGHMGDQIIKAEVVYEKAAFWADGYLLIDAECNDEELEIIGNKFDNPELLEAIE